MGNITGDAGYFESQWIKFNASALSAVGKATPMCSEGAGTAPKACWSSETFSFLNTSTHLFYRNGPRDHVYWARGNGWAISALVSAIEHGLRDPYRARYIDIYKLQAAELKAIQGADGAWFSSLLDGKGYPVPETTGTANFAYALAWGVNAKLLPAAEYLPVVEKAWAWLSTTALHPNGFVGNCQPGGGSPENNFGSNSTSNFCVGQFLLAASQVSRLSAAMVG